ncbi:MAG: hypothetical protein NTZ18_04120 [Candidatus Komeilibacteria bacterium]|nr:hypothetical protein [Candidatus Komeilibacteria bacterium]
MEKKKVCRSSKLNKLKFWLVTVDMGYGHQRAAYPLRRFAYQGVINANTYKGIPAKDKATWENQRKFYEFVSRFKRVPVVGDAVFSIMDWIQEIPKFYPKRDLSKPSLQVLAATYQISHADWGKHLIARLAKHPLPLVTPFFATAIMAEVNNYPGEIYCIICDADISRAWAAVAPGKSRIKYFAPNQRVVERLQEYGVAKNRIYLTGFPLPDENLGCPDFKILRDDLKNRFLNLDPNRIYLNKYKETLLKKLKIKSFPLKSNHPLTLTFAIGGAGAQRELGVAIIKYLAAKIKAKKITVILVAGIHHQISHYYRQAVIDLGLGGELNKGVKIIFERHKHDYFKTFNACLRKTDILWTKPSELCFYSALGLPIIIAPPIGSQEDFNRQWLIYLGVGVKQEKPQYVAQWLFDWLESGRLAEAAAQGFLDAPHSGVYNIVKIVGQEIKN